MSVIQQRHIVGGGGGYGFQEDRISQRQFVKSVETWASGWCLRGVKFTFTDGHEEMVGKAQESNQGKITFDWDNGESITSLSLWGNGAGTRCGGFRIKTNKNQDYFPHMTSWGLKTEYPMEIGSGIMLGAIGREGADIDALGFLMLRNITYVDMTNIKYNLRGDNLLPPRLISGLDVTLANPSRNPSDKGYKKVTKAKTTGGEWSVTAGVKFGQSYKVKGGVPFVAEGESTTSWEVSVSGSYGKNWSNTSTSETSVPLIAPALKKTRITVQYYEGTASNLPFTAQMKYVLDNGAKYYTNVDGIYEGVSNTRFIQDSKTVATWNEATNKWDELDA